MNNIIECIDVYKTYDNGKVKEEVLRGINFTVNKGEFVSIIGPSGSGKSTLLYLIGGLDVPTSGVIQIKNRDITGFNDNEISVLRRKNIGFVFQSYNLINNLNVEENILLPILLDYKNIKKYKQKLDELLEIVGLTNYRNYLPKQLSGGQKQRVAIARALINDPDIILADEPTGNLDSKASHDIMKLFKRINEEKKQTILMVTHSLELLSYTTRTIKVKDGMIINI
ncbi:MAG TPA: ABC transporter ATP-binding protein [Bacilli bacterium]